MSPLLFLLTSDVLQPLQLKDCDPIGWDGLRYLFARDTRYHGVALSISSDLTFVKQAAAYIRMVYEGGVDQNGTAVPAQGVEGLVALTVYEQNPNEFQPEEIYRGRLDFTSYVSEERGVTVKFRETGFATSLLTRDQTPVDLFGGESLSGLALPRYSPVQATLHSQETLLRYSGAVTGDPLVTGAGAVYDDPTRSQTFYFGYNEVSNELGLQQIAGGFVAGDADRAVAIFPVPDTGQYVLKLAGVVDVLVQAVNGSGTFAKVDTKFHYRINGNASTATLLASDNYSGPQDGFYSHTFTINPVTFTENLVPGDRIYLYAEVYVHEIESDLLGNYNFAVTATEQPGTYLQIQAVTTTAPTQCPGVLVHEALSRCCEACTDQRDALYSEYYGRTDTRIPYAQNGPASQRLLTNGFLLRGFPLYSAAAPVAPDTDSRKTITAALRDLYDSLDAIDCLGLGIEQRDGRSVVRIEPRAYFYQEAETLRLGRVTALKKSVYPDWLYNTADVGYSHWQSGAQNGLDEFNALRTYALPITQVKKAYSATSKLNAAGYLIEQARRDPYSEGNNKEGSADSELFVVTVRFVPAHTEIVLGVPVYVPDSYASARDEAFIAGSISGILSPATAYNLTLSPGRMLRQHGPWLRAGLFALTDRRLLLSKVEGNAHLKSQLLSESVPLDEFVNVLVSELGAPIVLAETYEFTTRLRRGQMKALAQNPYGRISFLDSQGTRKSGYLLRAERTPKGGSTTFTLLRAAS